MLDLPIAHSKSGENLSVFGRTMLGQRLGILAHISMCQDAKALKKKEVNIAGVHHLSVCHYNCTSLEHHHHSFFFLKY